MRALRFVIPGAPVACQRARSFVRGGKLIVTTPPATRAYEAHVAEHARSAVGASSWPCGGRGPFAVALDVYRVARRGDADNYAKGVKDGMTKAGVWADDRYVEELLVRLHVDKVAPRVEVEVRVLAEVDDAA